MCSVCVSVCMHVCVGVCVVDAFTALCLKFVHKLFECDCLCINNKI